jgi:hypothetical protein
MFDQAHGKCFVDYLKNGKSEPKPQIDESPIYDQAKIRRGESMTKRSTNSHLH